MSAPSQLSTAHSWPIVLSALLAGTQLTAEQASWAMEQIMSGAASEAQIAGFAVALRAKGESAAELSALTAVMLRRATPLPGLDGLRVVDVVGTGGDQAGTVNISTMAAIVVAAAGVPVMKHGNRAASSQCGSADLLEELGVVLELPPQYIVRSVHEVGIGFCFAAHFHPGMRHAAGVRRSLGVPTVFNFLGPLTNPAQPIAAMVGCADIAKAPILAEVLAHRGVSALVVRGEDGLDEFTTCAPTRVWVVNDGVATPTIVDAADLGIPRTELIALRGADAAYNATVARAVFSGESGPVADAVALTAAAALAAYDGLHGDLHTLLRTQLYRARQVLESGAAAELLRNWVAHQAP